MNRNNWRTGSIVVVNCLLLGFAALAMGDNPSASTIRASSIIADIKTRDAHAVVSTLWANKDHWDAVMKNIGRGKQEWLNVAIALHSGTDGGASEMLDEAVFLALKPSPVAVLKLLKDRQFETRSVCSSNIGTDYSPDQSRRFIKDRIKILTGLSNAETDAVRKQCLANLQDALKDLK